MRPLSHTSPEKLDTNDLKTLQSPRNDLNLVTVVDNSSFLTVSAVWFAIPSLPVSERKKHTSVCFLCGLQDDITPTTIQNVAGTFFKPNSLLVKWYIPYQRWDLSSLDLLYQLLFANSNCWHLLSKIVECYSIAHSSNSLTLFNKLMALSLSLTMVL